MLKKRLFRRKLINILKDRYSNWEEKSFYISKVISKETYGEEVFLEIIEKDQKPQIRKAAASVVGYLNLESFAIRLIDRVLLDGDWTVRFTSARSCARVLGEQAVVNLENRYNLMKEQVPSTEIDHKLKITFAEGLGAMGFENAIKILTSMLDSALLSRDPKSKELIVQIIYSLGEAGNESILIMLHNYIISNKLRTENIQNSAYHAVDKLAKKLGYSSYLNFKSKKNL